MSVVHFPMIKYETSLRKLTSLRKKGLSISVATQREWYSSSNVITQSLACCGELENVEEKNLIRLTRTSAKYSLRIYKIYMTIKLSVFRHIILVFLVFSLSILMKEHWYIEKYLPKSVFRQWDAKNRGWKLNNIVWYIPCLSFQPFIKLIRISRC